MKVKVCLTGDLRCAKAEECLLSEKCQEYNKELARLQKDKDDKI